MTVGPILPVSDAELGNALKLIEMVPRVIRHRLAVEVLRYFHADMKEYRSIWNGELMKAIANSQTPDNYGTFIGRRINERNGPAFRYINKLRAKIYPNMFPLIFSIAMTNNIFRVGIQKGWIIQSTGILGVWGLSCRGELVVNAYRDRSEHFHRHWVDLVKQSPTLRTKFLDRAWDRYVKDFNNQRISSLLLLNQGDD